ISAEAIGFRPRGPDTPLTVHLGAAEALDYAAGTCGIGVLARATEGHAGQRLTATLTWGDCTTCGQDPGPLTLMVGSDYHWLTVVSGQAVSSTPPPYTAVLKLTGDQIDIADLRTTSVYPQGGCSIAGPI